MNWNLFSVIIILIFFLFVVRGEANSPPYCNVSFPNGTPHIYLDPVEDRYLGDDLLTINGTTNLEIGSAVNAEVYSNAYSPGGGWQGSGMTDVIYVSKGCEFENRTYLTVNITDFDPGNYIVSEETQNGAVSDYKLFNILVPPHAYFTIDPIGTRVAGEIFYIEGTTNMPLSDKWVGWIYSKSDPNNLMIIAPGLPDLSTTQESPGIIRYSVNVTNATRNLANGEYNVVVGINHVASTTIEFTIVPAWEITNSNNIQTTIPTTPTTILRTTMTTLPKPTKYSGCASQITVISLCVFILIVMHRH